MCHDLKLLTIGFAKDTYKHFFLCWSENFSHVEEASSRFNSASWKWIKMKQIVTFVAARGRE